MLVSLTLNNLALIDEYEISFDDKFNVITGETGAGKSLILDALSLCAGERADAGMVRHGTQEASVFGEFDVANNHQVAQWFVEHERVLEDDTLLIRRKIGANGRSKSWINGVPASISELKSLGLILVNIHSQHSGLELLKPQFVVDWLDNLGVLGELKNATKAAYQDYQTMQRQADEAKSKSAQRADRIALLGARLADVEPLLSVNLEDVESEYDELSNLESLMQDAVLALNNLDNDTDSPSVSSMLAKAMKVCDNHANTSKVFDECSQLLAIASEQISETVSRLTDYAEQSLPDQARLDELNNLLGLAHRLSNKYHTPVSELMTEAMIWQQELNELVALPDGDTLDAQVTKAYQAYLECATALNQARQDIAPTVCQSLQANLAPLALPNVYCEFVFDNKSPPQYNVHGISEISLMFSANKGMPPQPLHKVASGGELSRIALVMQVMAFKQCCQNAYPTLVFDEVDVGISGSTAQVVGELLRSLGERQQLLAITHQAQVAAAAHRHILVHKEHDEQTTSRFTIIAGDAQIDELARMSGGVVITEATKAHAKSLLADIGKTNHARTQKSK